MLIYFSCVWLCDPVDYSPSDSSVHGDSPGKNTGVGWHAFLQGIFLTQGLNLHPLHLLHWQMGSLPWLLPGKDHLSNVFRFRKPVHLFPELCLPLLPLRVACLDFFFSQKMTLSESKGFPGRCLVFITDVSTESCYYQVFLNPDCSCIKPYLHKNTVWHPALAFIGWKCIIRFQ